MLWQPLERKQLYKRGKFGFYRVYGKWVVPDVATAPVRLRGATVDIRHDSTDEEVATGKYRERGLCPVPPADPDFDRCYNIREDVESWHHYLKSQLPNRRARSVGIRRQRFDMHALQLALITTTLLAWHERTGGDLQPWFGQSRPPNQDHATAA